MIVAMYSLWHCVRATSNASSFTARCVHKVWHITRFNSNHGPVSCDMSSQQSSSMFFTQEGKKKKKRGNEKGKRRGGKRGNTRGKRGDKRGKTNEKKESKEKHVCLDSWDEISCVVLVVGAEPLTASRRNGTGALRVLTGTHRCDDPPRQGGGSPERQLVQCVDCIVLLLVHCEVVMVNQKREKKEGKLKKRGFRRLEWHLATP